MKVEICFFRVKNACQIDISICMQGSAGSILKVNLQWMFQICYIDTACFGLKSTKSYKYYPGFIWTIATITPATVISIPYNLSYAKYDYLCTTESSVVSLFVERLYVAYSPLDTFFTHRRHVFEQTRNISRALSRTICIRYMFSTHMDTV